MKILVTGSSGFIGSALIKHLSHIEGFSVVGLVRSKNNIITNNDCEYRLGDLASSNIKNINLNDIDIIIHTAGRAHITNETSSQPIAEFRRVNTYGTIDLARLAKKAGVKRFIFLSSIKVNGESTKIGVPFSINSRETPCDAYGLSKLEAEVGLREVSDETGLEVTIIRPPLVYGPGVKGNLRSLIKILSANIPLPLASIKNNRRSMIALDNLINFISLCAQHPKAINKTFFVSDNNDLSTYYLLKLLGDSIGKSVILFSVPVFILKFISKVFKMETQFQRLTGSLQVDISYTCNELGWKPLITVEQGIKRLNNEAN